MHPVAKANALPAVSPPSAIEMAFLRVRRSPVVCWPSTPPSSVGEDEDDDDGNEDDASRIIRRWCGIKGTITGAAGEGREALPSEGGGGERTEMGPA